MEQEKLITLVEATKNGDEGAFNTLFTEFYENLYYFAFKYVKNQDIACDITQETFTTIFESIGTLKEPAAFIAWSRQIAYRHCLQHFRKKQEVLVEEDEDGNSIFDMVEDTSTDFIPDEVVEQTEFKETIMGMIDELPEEQRAAVLLLYYEQLTVKQIAEVQGVSEGTVKSRLNYGRKAVKTAVEEYEKKHNIKLHSFSLAPFLYWLFTQDKAANPMPQAVVKRIAEGLTAKVATTSATVTSTVANIGIGAKIAALPLAGKVAACVAAVAIVVGAGVGVGATIQNSKKPEETIPVHQDDMIIEEADDPVLSMMFEEYMWFVTSLGTSQGTFQGTEGTITTFQSTEELTTDDFLWEIYRGTTVGSVELTMAEEHKGTDEYGRDIYIYTAKVSDLNNFTQALFGRTFDYKEASGTHIFFGEYYYDASSDSIVYDNTDGGEGGGDIVTEFRYACYSTTDDVNYVVTYKEYNVEDDTLTGKVGEMKVKKVNGNMTIVSNVIN